MENPLDILAKLNEISMDCDKTQIKIDRAREIFEEVPEIQIWLDIKQMVLDGKRAQLEIIKDRLASQN